MGPQFARATLGIHEPEWLCAVGEKRGSMTTPTRAEYLKRRENEHLAFLASPSLQGFMSLSARALAELAASWARRDAEACDAAGMPWEIEKPAIPEMAERLTVETIKDGDGPQALRATNDPESEDGERWATFTEADEAARCYNNRRNIARAKDRLSNLTDDYGDHMGVMVSVGQLRQLAAYLDPEEPES